MKKIGKKFKPEQKLATIQKWLNLGGGKRNAERVARMYLCSTKSIYLWHHKYDGTIQSLANGDQTPHHLWNKYTAEQLDQLKTVHNENENIGRMELYAKLREKFAFDKSASTFYRMLKILNVAPVQQLQKYIAEPYDTPTMIGVKWQIDVKFVPAICLSNIQDSAFYYRAGIRYYQYTCIDECSRKRFVFAYDSFGTKETLDFIKRAIVYFGYKPLIVQTDNGGEFAMPADKRLKHKHLFTLFLESQGIRHQTIRPYTPRHNGKVERSHRTDNQEFYNFYQGRNGFANLGDLRTKQKDWLYRYNYKRIMSVHKYKTPAEVEQKLLVKLKADCGAVEYLDYDRQTKLAVVKAGTVKFVKQNIDLAFAV